MTPQKADMHVNVGPEGTVLGLEALFLEDLVQATKECGGKIDVPEKIGAPVR